MGIGANMDPGPYILAAYSIAALLLIGYSVWQLQLRTKLRQLENATREGGSP